MLVLTMSIFGAPLSIVLPVCPSHRRREFFECAVFPNLPAALNYSFSLHPVRISMCELGNLGVVAAVDGSIKHLVSFYCWLMC
jgi:hypothetical protein